MPDTYDRSQREPDDQEVLSGAGLEDVPSPVLDRRRWPEAEVEGAADLAAPGAPLASQAALVPSAHVIPRADLVPHVEDVGCVCGPEVERVGGGLVITHHSLDGRE